MDQEVAGSAWRRLPGIVGGLGPHAHVDFERRLLSRVEVTCDQGYPPWLLSSLPQTPDRTTAVLGRGPSPASAILLSLRRLADGGADFAVIACITAHAFLDEVYGEAPLPILDVVEASLDVAGERAGANPVGVLATTGTLRSRLFEQTAERLASPPEVLTLAQLPDGERLQEELVMKAIYGLKTGAEGDPSTGVAYRDLLIDGADRLVRAGAGVVVAGCTEIGMVLGGEAAPEGMEVVDPLDVAADRVLGICRGERPLPGHYSEAGRNAAGSSLSSSPHRVVAKT